MPKSTMSPEILVRCMVSASSIGRSCPGRLHPRQGTLYSQTSVADRMTPTKAEIEAALENDRVLRRMDSQDDLLKEIKSQCIRTNGRVSDLERWRAYCKGALAVACLLVPLIIFH